MSTSPAATCSAGDELVALDHADREADQVELAGLHGAGVLGHLAADEGAARPGGSPRPRPRRAARCGRGRGGRPRCSRGRTAARRPGTPGRRRTWPPGRRRWCRSGRRPGPPAPWCRPRRWTTPAPAGGSGPRRSSNRPPNPPMSPMTSGRKVERTLALMRSTASSPASMSTPAACVGLAHGRSGAAERASAAGSGLVVAQQRQPGSERPRPGRSVDLEHVLAQARPGPSPGSCR